MTYRCGWGTKPGQETVLAVEIARDGFEWALRHACLSSYVRGGAPRLRDLAASTEACSCPVSSGTPNGTFACSPCRTGLCNSASPVRLCDATRTWTVAIRDVTPLAHEIHALVSSGDLDLATRLQPAERPYPAADELSADLRP